MELNSTGFANNRLKTSQCWERLSLWLMTVKAINANLFDAIERGDFPKWKLCIQVMTEEQANNMPLQSIRFNKVWYHDEFH